MLRIFRVSIEKTSEEFQLQLILIKRGNNLVNFSIFLYPTYLCSNCGILRDQLIQDKNNNKKKEHFFLIFRLVIH